MRLRFEIQLSFCRYGYPAVCSNIEQILPVATCHAPHRGLANIRLYQQQLTNFGAG